MDTLEEIEETIEKRKTKFKNFFTGWVKDNYDKTFLIVLGLAFLIRICVFIVTKDPIKQFSPILTLLSITLLLPI